MKKQQTLTCLVILVTLLLQSLPLFSQKLEVKIDGKRILNTVSVMAADQQMGRKPNTPEFFKLQDWVVSQYKAWGMEPAGENGTFYQSVPITREYAVTYGTPKMVINGREFFAYQEDFTLDTRSTTGTKLKSKIVFVGYGISAPDKGLDEYANLDVKGKFVFVLKGDPGDFKPPRGMLSRQETPEAEKSEDWENESADTTKIQTAYTKGAAGIILYNPDPETGRFPRGFRPTLETASFKRDFIVISKVSEEVFHWIFWTDSQMSSRGFSTWMSDIRSDIKKKKSRSFETKMAAEIQSFEKTLLKGKKFNDDKGRNIIAKVTGTDPELKNQFVIVGAHFDHLGVTNGQIYNGAEDNATGSAVVMELARLMKEHNLKTKRTVILCLWTGEELGLIGSNYWVTNPTDSVKMEQVVSYFNMDMVGLGETISAPGALNFPSIWDVIKKDQQQSVLDIVKPRTGGPGGSDHSAFIEQGIEALALMTDAKAGHPDYHDTGDDVQKLNPEILKNTCQFVLQGIMNLGNETTTNLLIADRHDIYSAMQWGITLINPDLGGERGWSVLEIKNADSLSKVLKDKIGELKRPQAEADDFRSMMRRRFSRTSLTTGVKGVEIFNHNLHLIQVAKELLDFGRIDMMGDDGVWFNKGLTEKGAAALEMLGKNRIVLHLIKPEKATLESVLKKFDKPFLVSNFTEYDDSLIACINKKKILVGVDFNPEDVEGCVHQLETLKAKFGDIDNLLLNVTSKINLDEAKKELYAQLLKKGWEKKDIYAIGGVGTTRRGRGNLERFGGGPGFPFGGGF
ncbi:M28 family peptidase [candidate division KSB1 bacterium]|nr:M28 family peptidase [candidate division KSB1 bacterium]